MPNKRRPLTSNRTANGDSEPGSGGVTAVHRPDGGGPSFDQD